MRRASELFMLREEAWTALWEAYVAYHNKTRRPKKAAPAWTALGMRIAEERALGELWRKWLALNHECHQAGLLGQEWLEMYRGYHLNPVTGEWDRSMSHRRAA